jgi:hypothetical protein
MDWKYGSSSRVPTLQVPALQVQSPEFKPQSHQKKGTSHCPEFEFYLSIWMSQHLFIITKHNIWSIPQFYEVDVIITIL